MKADFIGIGATRSGSSWIFRCLEDHPEICTSYIKETNFFSNHEDYEAGIEKYERYFDGAPNGKIRGEYSPLYLSDENVPDRIKKHYPAAKLIVSLRDPVEAVYSCYHFLKKRGLHNHESFEDFLASEPSRLKERLYFQHLRRYLDAFRRENILVLIYEDIEKDPVNFMRNIYLFLGVDPRFVSKNAVLRINAGGDYSVFRLSRALSAAARGLGRFALGKKLVKVVSQSRIKSGVDRLFELNKEKTTQKTTRPEMKRTTREFLKEFYEKDIGELERLLNRDLALWQQIGSET